MPSREPDLYKDKVEISLDGRQIFYLFFGGAVVVGVVFVLGVLVGRRVEARGHIDRARTHAAADPLAALDRLEGNGGLTFRGALTGKEATSDVERKIGDLEKARADKKADKSADRDEPKAAKADPEAPTEKTAKTEKTEKPETTEKTDKTDKATEKATAKPTDKTTDKTTAKTTAKATDKTTDKTAKVDPAEADRRYTLQLSSFQDRAEAEAFLAGIKAQGYSAQIKEAQVEGKGTFYRVRMGTYRSVESANSAKADFERDAKKSASVMKL